MGRDRGEFSLPGNGHTYMKSKIVINSLISAKKRIFLTNLWHSSSENSLVLLLVDVPVFVVCFENMFDFFFNTSLTMKLVYKFLQEYHDNGQEYKSKGTNLYCNNNLILRRCYPYVSRSVQGRVEILLVTSCY